MYTDCSFVEALYLHQQHSIDSLPASLNYTSTVMNRSINYISSACYSMVARK